MNEYMHENTTSLPARSPFFFKPAKTILVPGMYLAGFSRYVHKVSLLQVIPFFLLASVYVNPTA